MKILCLESSCDETSIAIIDENYKIYSHVTNTQIEEFSKYGGVIPELSSRLHEKNIYYVYNQAINESKLKISDIDYLAVTVGPGLVGSLLCGINFIKTLSFIYKIPVIEVNHMQAHISSLYLEHEVKYPMLSLVVSGGHTMIVKCDSPTEYKIIGQTLDDACGECFDKVARVLDLGYPGGPKIDELSKSGKVTYEFVHAKDDNSYDFSYSGLKSNVFNFVNQSKMKNIDLNKSDLAASFQFYAIEILVKKMKKASFEYGINNISVVGGVSANSYLQKRMYEEFSKCMFVSHQYCTDNAAMIGARAIFDLNNAVSFEKINLKVNLSVEKNCQD